MEPTFGTREAIMLGGVIVAAIALLFTVVQIYLAKRKERFESTMWLFERLQDPVATRARFRVENLMLKAQQAHQDKHNTGGHDFEALTYKERAELASIGGLMGVAGLLFRRGRIDRRLFLDAWASSVRRNYARLHPYMTWRDDLLGPNNSLWREFGRIAEICALAESPPKKRKLSFFEWLAIRGS